MIEMYCSRHMPDVKGSEILWQAGERARCKNMTRPSDNGRVVIIQDGQFKTHSKAPGNGVVLEFTFLGESELHCVLADNLEPLEGFPVVTK